MCGSGSEALLLSVPREGRARPPGANGSYSSLQLAFSWGLARPLDWDIGTPVSLLGLAFLIKIENMAEQPGSKPAPDEQGQRLEMGTAGMLSVWQNLGPADPPGEENKG